MERFWSLLKGLWARLTGASSDKPDVAESADLEQVPDIAPNDKDVVPAEPETDKRTDVEFTRDAIAKHAELYETNQPALMEDATEFINGEHVVIPLFVEAAYLVNWPEVVKQYSQKTMHRILGSGTNFNFRGHEDLERYVTDAVRRESAERSPGAPDRNGMAEDGGQR